jgi:hypothetical protein
MHIEVGPARRPGNASAIYDEPLKDDDLQLHPDGGLTLTIDASGMKDQRSRYRYRFRFTPDELDRWCAAREASVRGANGSPRGEAVADVLSSEADVPAPR